MTPFAAIGAGLEPYGRKNLIRQKVPHPYRPLSRKKKKKCLGKNFIQELKNTEPQTMPKTQARRERRVGPELVVEW